MKAYLGTRGGVWRFDTDTRECVHLGLEQHRVWAIHAWSDNDGNHRILAGSYGAGIFRSADSGTNWERANIGLTANALRTLQPDPTKPGAILAGTEPARGFRSIDGGLSWREFESIAEIEGVDEWFLPYSPRSGAIRNFVATRNGELFASIEVGGLLHSPDGGERWSLIRVDPGPRVHDDIHQVIVDPDDERRLFVAMGGALVDRTHGQWPTEPRQIGGVAVSEDSGANWNKLRPDYTRAILIPQSSTDWLIAAPAQRTNQGGWIVGSTDRGASWEPIDAGIETPMGDMVERFEEAPDGSVWALCSGGRVFSTKPGVWNWSNPIRDAASNLIVESVAFVGA